MFVALLLSKEPANLPSVSDVKAYFSISDEWAKHQKHLLCLRSFDQTFSASTQETQLGEKGQVSKLPTAQIPMRTGPGFATKETDVYFSATYYNAAGGLSVDSDLFNEFVPRSVATSFNFDKTHTQEISKCMYVGEEISKFIINNAFGPVDRHYAGMENLIKATASDISKELEGGDWKNIAEYVGSDGHSGILAFCRDRILSHLNECADLSAKKKAKIEMSVRNLAECPIQANSMADNCGEPEFGAFAKEDFLSKPNKRQQEAEDAILNSNITVTIKEADQVNRQLGLLQEGAGAREYSGVCSIYYDSRYWSSGTGLAILEGQTRMHVTTVEGAFLAANPDPRYLALPIYERCKQNLLSASPNYSSSVQTVLSELNSIEDELSKLNNEMQKYARSKNPNTKLLPADLDAAYDHLLSSDSDFASRLDAVHARLSAFTKKYAIARLYGSGGPKYNKKDQAQHVLTPTSVAKGVFGRADALPAEQVAGYMAMDYAMNYLGRGLPITIAGDRTLQKIEYEVDPKDARVTMGINNDRNHGQVQVILQVKYDKKKSVVVEDEGQTEADIRLALAPALQSSGATIDAVRGIRVIEDSQYRIYSVPILRDFTIKSEADAQALNIKIEVPTSINNPGSRRLTLLELTASTFNFDMATDIKEPDKPKYFSMELQGGLSHTNIQGNRKNLAKGGDLSNAYTGSELTDQAHRDTSTGGIVDLASMISHDPLLDWYHARRATYFSDRNKSPYEWASSGILSSDAAAFNTPENLSLNSDAYLSSFKKAFDPNVDKYIKAGFTGGLDDILKQDKDLADKPHDFLDNLANIRKDISPLYANLAYWSLYKGALLQNLQFASPMIFAAGGNDFADFQTNYNNRSLPALDPSTLNRINGLAPGQGFDLTIGGKPYHIDRNADHTFSLYDTSKRPLYEGIQKEINVASARYITTPINEIAPGLFGGVRAQGEMYDAIMRVNQTAKEMGVSAVFHFNALGRDNRLQVTFSQGIGPSDNQYFSPTLAYPNAGMTAQVNNATMIVLDHLINVYKYQKDETLFRMDFNTQVNLFLTSNYRYYDYNVGVQNAYRSTDPTTPGVWDIFAEHRLDTANLHFSNLGTATKVLQGKIFANDFATYDLCQELIAVCDPYNNEDKTVKGQKAADLMAKLSKRVLSPRYLGGNETDTTLAEGMYMNGLDTYIGRDMLPFGGIVPIPVMGLKFRFEQENSSVFGALPFLGVDPKDAALRLKITGEAFLPSWLITTPAKLFMDPDGVPAKVIEQSPQVLQNLIPPVNFNADLSRFFDITPRYALITGFFLAGSATGFKINDIGVYVKNLLKVPEINTTAYLDLTARFNGTMLGNLGPSAMVSAGTFTQVSEKMQIGTQIYGMVRDYPYSSVKGFGTNIQFRWSLFDAPRTADEPVARINWYEWEKTNKQLYGEKAQKKDDSW